MENDTQQTTPRTLLGRAAPPPDLRPLAERLMDDARRMHSKGVSARKSLTRLYIVNRGRLPFEEMAAIHRHVYAAPTEPFRSYAYRAAESWADADDRPLPLIAYDDVMRAEVEPPEWDVEPIIARGERVIIYGEWSGLKSWMALDLALHLAAGKPWLDGTFPIPKARKVLYIDEEMHPRALRRRIKRLGLGLDLPDGTSLPFQALNRFGVKLNAVGAVKLLKHLAASAFMPEVIVIDTMRRVMLGSENEQSDVSTFWDSVMPLVKAGVTVIVVHHMRKARSKSESARDRFSGNTDIAAGTDASMAVTRYQGEPAAKLEFMKSRETEEAEAIVIRLEDSADDTEHTGPIRLVSEGTPDDYQTTVVGEVAESAKRATALVEFVKGKGTATTAEIVAYITEHFDAKKRTVERDIKAAVTAGHLIAVSKGFYQLAPIATDTR